MNEQQQMDRIFLCYIWLLLLFMLLFWFGGKLYDHGVITGHTQGFKEGQIAAMQGQWSYAPQVVITTNMVLTNYVKMIKGVPQSLKMDIKAVPNKVDNGNSFTFTAPTGFATFLNIKDGR